MKMKMNEKTTKRRTKNDYLIDGLCIDHSGNKVGIIYEIIVIWIVGCICELDVQAIPFTWGLRCSRRMCIFADPWNDVRMLKHIDWLIGTSSENANASGWNCANRPKKKPTAKYKIAQYPNWIRMLTILFWLLLLLLLLLLYFSNEQKKWLHE